MQTIDNHINGTYAAPSSGKYMDKIAPATGKMIGKIACSNANDVQHAVEAARKAKRSWAEKPIAERSRILHRLADLIEENLEELAKAESIDTGKPITAARNIDIPRAAANFRFFASAIINQSTTAHMMEGEAVNYTRRGALGIVGCISPWNLPLYLFTWKIAPALAMGNCVIGKPSEVTPTTAYLLGRLACQAGIPPGVLNILQGLGPEVGQAIVEHPEIKAISFTGGTATGRIIGTTAASQFKKVSLELGGKNPTVIFEDCDFEDTVSQVVRSAFSNQGEICLCGSRILIQASIYSDFKEAFLTKIKELKKGDPLNPETEFGALISKDHKAKVLDFIEEAKKDGGSILAGGKEYNPDNLKGYFVEPTVIEGLDTSCQINQEEVFGPVVTLIPFKDDVDALSIANGTSYGLAASIWTSNLKMAHRFAHQLEHGIVWVNCWMLRDLRTPFGGMKNSGVGREGGDEALRFFSEAQNICVKL